MTYEQLLRELGQMPPKQLMQNVTVYVPDDEYIPVRSVCTVGPDSIHDPQEGFLGFAGPRPGVLDEYHIVLNTEGE